MFNSMKCIMVLTTALGLFFSSCKKEKNDTKENDPYGAAGQLQVRFSDKTISFGKVISGFVVLQRENTTIQVMKTFVKGNNLLKIDIDDMQEGKYEVTIHVDAQPKENSGATGTQYRLQKQIRITKEGVAIDAPVNQLKKDWKLYATFTDATRSVIATVPLDCTDPYFEFIVNDTRWNYFYVQRKAFKKDNNNNSSLVAEHVWQCDNDCYDNNHFIANSADFKNWTDLMATKEWDGGNMMVITMHQETGEEKVFLFDYDLADLQ